MEQRRPPAERHWVHEDAELVDQPKVDEPVDQLRAGVDRHRAARARLERRDLRRDIAPDQPRVRPTRRLERGRKDELLNVVHPLRMLALARFGLRIIEHARPEPLHAQVGRTAVHGHVDIRPDMLVAVSVDLLVVGASRPLEPQPLLRVGKTVQRHVLYCNDLSHSILHCG